MSPHTCRRDTDGADESQSNESINLFNDSATRTRSAASAGRRSPGHFDYSSSCPDSGRDPAGSLR